MKRVSRWLARVCMAAVLFGAVGLEAVSVNAEEAPVSPLVVETPENRVQTYQCGEPQDFVLNIRNTSTERIANVVVSPVLKDKGDEWPFVTDYQSYEARLEGLNPSGTEGDAGSVVFGFTQRDDAGAARYQLTFQITAGIVTVDEDGKETIENITTEKSFYVNTSAKIEEIENPEENLEENQEEIPEDLMLAAGGFDTGEASYVGGGGSSSSGNGSVPRVIVTGFTTNPGDVRAGSDFVLTVHLKNTSKKTRVNNMLFELQAPTEGKDEQTIAPAFLPTSGSNSIYMEGIPAGGTADISISLNAKSDLVQKPYEIGLSMKYEDSDAAQIEAGASLSIPVKQNVRFEFSEFEITPESIEVGSEANVSCNLYNLGRIKLYNVKAIFEGDGIKKEEVFLGNVEPGTSTAIDAMLEGTKASEGEGKVKMTLSYEDEAGTVATAEESFNLMVMEAMESGGDMMTEGMMEEPKAGLPIVPIAVAAAIVIILIVVTIMRKKRKARKLLAEEEELLDELDGPSEDEQQ